MKEKPKVKIEDWYVWQGELYGKVYGHPYCTDGREVRSSMIEVREEKTIETQNTIYELGKEKVLIHTEQPEEEPS